MPFFAPVDDKTTRRTRQDNPVCAMRVHAHPLQQQNASLLALKWRQKGAFSYLNLQADNAAGREDAGVPPCAER